MARRSALRVSRPHLAQNTTPCLCRDDGFAGDDDADDDDDDDDDGCVAERGLSASSKMRKK